MEPLPKSPLNEQTIWPDTNFDRYSVCIRSLDPETSFIIRQFRERHYMTMMAEDWAYGALNWPECPGFKDPPADHYMRFFDFGL